MGNANSRLIAGDEDVEDKKDSWVLNKGAAILGVFYSLYHIIIITNTLEMAGRNINAISHRAISLGLTLILIFILYPLRRGSSKKKVPWWDWILIFLGTAACTFIVLYYEFLWTDPNIYPFRGNVGRMIEGFLALITIVLVLEITRRVMGLALPLVAAAFLFYTVFCDYFPGYFRGRGYSISRISEHLFLWSEGIWGVAMGVAATTIVCFFIFSAFLNEAGAGNFFSKLAVSIFGTRRGGSAKSVIISDILFGMVSGSTTASVVTTGVFTIPMMKKDGYSANYAGAVEIVASNGGQIMPPVMGAVAFVMCELLGLSYRTVILSAGIPALLYWFLLFITLDVDSAKRGFIGHPRSELPPFIKTIKAGWPHLIPIAAIMTFLLVLKYTPELSALYGLGVMLVISLISKNVKMGAKGIIRSLEKGAKGMVMVTTACATAGIIIGCMTLTGVGAKFSMIVLSVAQGNMLPILCLSAAACYILGMGMSSIPVYLTVVLTVSPSLIQVGINPLAAHLFVFWWALASFITPPVAIAAFAAAGISGGDPFKTGLKGMRLGAGLYIIPFLFVYRPGLILQGTLDEIILQTVVCLVLIVALVGSFNGYLLTKTKLWERILLGFGSILMAKPGWTSTLGMILIAPPMVYQLISMMRKREKFPGKKTKKNFERLGLKNDLES